MEEETVTQEVGDTTVDLSEDVARLKNALSAERQAHKDTKNRFRFVGDLTAEGLQALKDKAEDADFRGGLDDGAIEERAEKLANRRTRAIERQLEDVTAERDAHLSAIGLHEAAASVRAIHEAVEAASVETKLAEGALLDVRPFAERNFEVVGGEVVARDAVEGIDPGTPLAEALATIQSAGKRPHWFVENVGAGATGASEAAPAATGNNPFARESFNMTEAGRILKTDPAKARELVTAAGEDPSRYGLA